MDLPKLARKISHLASAASEEAEKKGDKQMVAAASVLYYVSAVMVTGEMLSLAKLMEEHPFLEEEFDEGLVTGHLTNRLEMLTKRFRTPEGGYEDKVDAVMVASSMSVIYGLLYFMKGQPKTMMEFAEKFQKLLKNMAPDFVLPSGGTSMIS